MITKEADYALRVMLFLARAGEAAASTARLAAELDIPYRFLRKIVRRMVEAGLIGSRRGKGGGVRLKRPAERISLLDVLNAMDRRGVALNACGERGQPCPRHGGCAVHPELRGVQRAIDERLAGITFAALARAPRRA